MTQSTPKVLLNFDTPLTRVGGGRYLVRACGRETELGTWEGWLEYEPLGDGEVLRTPRETTQPNEKALVYWATGLSDVYLEGALERALAPEQVIDLVEEGRPTFDGPAPARRGPGIPAADARPRPVLDPFIVYAQGEGVLRDELRALNRSHLLNIVHAYALAGDDPTAVRALNARALATVIVEAVARRTAAGGRAAHLEGQ
ncbi:MAG: hypothetical protein ACREON_10470 [Gemmatimonadaceae bacterium]